MKANSHVGFYNPWRALAAGILRRAVLDFKRGQPCGQRCSNEVHKCKQDAVEFLRGSWAAFLFDAVGISQGRCLSALGIRFKIVDA